MLVMRFANPIFGAWWNRNYVSNVQISFKEDFGTQVRGGGGGGQWLFEAFAAV